MRALGATIVLLFATHAAQAASLSGHSALALGALVGLPSPTLTPLQKARLDLLLHGHAGHWPVITVKADSVVCQAGNVDISHFACTLTFGSKTASLTGRLAHELFATVAEAGVPPDGAAGTIYEGLHALTCAIDPTVVAAKAGGGATCDFTPGPP